MLRYRAFVDDGVVIRRGRHAGRPSLLRVHVPCGITVSGTAVPIPSADR